MKKNYSHNPRQMADVELIRAGNLMKEKPDFFNLERDGTFKQLDNHSPRRRLEFNSANHFYLCDAAKYLCTHYKEKLSLGAINYIETTIDWDAFKEITIGKYKDQYRKLLYELNGSQRYCYIPKEDGGYYIMPPFRLDFTTESQEGLSEKQSRKLKNIGVQKIKSVTFSMAKPLFLKYIEGGQYYKHPVNLYANIYHNIPNIEATIKGSPQFKDMCHENYGCTEFIAAYIRLIDYLYIHGAGTHDKISVKLPDMLSKVMPSLCQFNERGEMKFRKINKLWNFMVVAVTILNKLDGLDYKLKPLKMPEGTNMVYEFDH
jgi:hypothetical protein